MKQILAEIQSGDFAREWIAENRAGQENFKRMRAEQAATQVETTGKELRSMMDWIDDRVPRVPPGPPGGAARLRSGRRDWRSSGGAHHRGATAQIPPHAWASAPTT